MSGPLRPSRAGAPDARGRFQTDERDDVEGAEPAEQIVDGERRPIEQQHCCGVKEAGASMPRRSLLKNHDAQTQHEGDDAEARVYQAERIETSNAKHDPEVTGAARMASGGVVTSKERQLSRLRTSTLRFRQIARATPSIRHFLVAPAGCLFLPSSPCRETHRGCHRCSSSTTM